MTNNNIDFDTVYWYALRAQAAYESPENIKKQFSSIRKVGLLEDIEIQYFIEDVKDQNALLISIRGTDNLTNIKNDAEFLKSKSSKLGIYAHEGFRESAEMIYEEVQPELKSDKTILFTGHSLGAALSTLLMMYCHCDGYQIGKSYNFGQPKVPNADGVDKYDQLPLVRVVNEDDLVPMVPPVNLLDVIHGAYQHLGEKLLLLNDNRYVLLDKEEAEERSIGSFWDNMGHHSVLDHKMDDYLKNIQNNMKLAIEVPYEDRHEYS